MIEQHHTAVGVFFIIVGALFTLAAGRNLFNRDTALVAPFRGPIIAMEMARTDQQVANLLAYPDADARPPLPSTNLDAGRAFVKKNTQWDNRLIIPLYVVVFSAAAAFAFWCAPQKFGFAARVAGVVVCVAMIGSAAWFDVRENRGTLNVLEKTGGMNYEQTTRAGLEPTLRVVSSSATVKFALLFLVTLVIAAPVTMRGGWGYGLSLFFAASALVGLVSLAPRFHALLEIGFTLTCLCLLLLGIWFLRLPQAH